MPKTKAAGRASSTFANMKLCGAKARQNNHQPCRQPAMANGRCRLHGGKSTGPKTAEGKKKAAAASYKHGRHTNEAIKERQRMQMMMAWRKDLAEIESQTGEIDYDKKQT